MLEYILIPLAGLVLGILALKLPYKYNPFRLKFGAGDDSPTAQRLPKVFGWLLVGFCGLWLLGIVTLFTLGHFLSR